MPSESPAGGDSAELLLRAAWATDLSICITDPHQPDNPLVWVNSAFENDTGYPAAAILGRNCRFLQGPNTDPAAIDRIRERLRTHQPITETLLNYRADGSPFWNELFISPMRDADGRVSHYVGVQSDVTERVEANLARDRALLATRRSNARLAALSAVSVSLATRIESFDAIGELAAIVAQHCRGWAAVIDTTAPTPRIAGWAFSDPAVLSDTSTVLADAQAALDASFAQLRRLIAGAGEGQTLSLRVAPGYAAAAGAALGRADVVRAGDLVSIGALHARGELFGVLVIGSGDDDSPFADAAAFADLCVRVSVAVDNVRLYAREHIAALTLQRSLLPRLPEVDGFDIAARYEPSAAEVGGDWYDVLHLPSTGDLGVAIGDVMGHDLAAAASMGQLRSVLRSYAWAGDSPSTVLGRLDELVRALDMAALATCIYAVVRRDGQGQCRIAYSSAGHLPAMLRMPDGTVRRLDQALTTPIGAGSTQTAPQAETEFPPGSALVLYTDGILERRDRDIDACLDAFERLLAGLNASADAETIAAALIADAPAGDDACVLVVRRPLT